MPSAVNPRRWWALIALAFAQFITIMDTSIIGVALPDIQQALGFSPEGLSWVSTPTSSPSAACCCWAASSATLVTENGTSVQPPHGR